MIAIPGVSASDAAAARSKRKQNLTSQPSSPLGIAPIPAFVLMESMERGTLDLALGD